MISNASANPVLSGHYLEFMRDPSGFVAELLLPTFNSGEQSARYYVFERENFLFVPTDIQRAPGAPHKEVRARISDDAFSCLDYGLKMPVPDEDRRKYASYLDADLAAIRRITDIIKVNREIRVRDLVTNTANVPSAGVAVKWDDPGSDPFTDVDAAKEAIRQGIGLMANVMVINTAIKDVLKKHPKFLERIKYTGSGGALPEEELLRLLAVCFGVGRMAVAGTILATSAEGQAITASDIWSDTVVLAHAEAGQDMMRPNFGRTFNWTAMGSVDTPVKTWRDDDRVADIHAADQYVGEKLTGASAGFLLTDALAAA